jgi:hypothetical protein
MKREEGKRYTADDGSKADVADKFKKVAREARLIGLRLAGEI